MNLGNQPLMKTLGEIARYVGGELRGDETVSIKRVVHPALVQDSSDLALILSPTAVSFLASGKIANAVLPAGIDDIPTQNQIVVSRPRLVLARLTELFERPAFVAPGIHPSAVIDPSASLGENVQIGPFCWVGPNSVIGAGSHLVAHVSVGSNVSIGQNSLLHAGVRVGDFCQIGSRVILQPNATIGGDGFAFVTPEPGSVESVRETGEVRSFNTELIRINSIGIVILEDDVEIGSGSCVDRGTLGETRIGQGSKIDNLVQVGHNVTIGRNCLIVAQVGLGGSSQVGDRAVVGGQAGLPDHLTIGEDAVIHAQAGITGHVDPKAVVIGSPAITKSEFLEQQLSIKRVPKLTRAVRELKAQVAEMLGKRSQEPGSRS
jgi:UDP-3-O-[3-hydroxymyristoyl] glucosamine N-acyltransferase